MLNSVSVKPFSFLRKGEKDFADMEFGITDTDTCVNDQQIKKNHSRS